MKKVFTLLAALGVATTSAFAGGILTNTNQHVNFLRDPARDATTDIDAIYSNPAGISFMNLGWHFSFNGQSAFQNRDITSTFAPFAENADGHSAADGTRKYKGVASAPFIPSVFAVWRYNDRWTFGGNFALTGGGGKATFNDGLPSFESQVALIPALLSTYATQMNMPELASSQYSYNTFMQGRQYIFGLNFGSAYKFNKHLSGFVGMRINYVTNHYYGYVKNIKATLAGSTTLVDLNNYFSNISSQFATLAIQSQIAGNTTLATQYTKLAVATAKIASGTSDKELDCSQTGWGVTPIIGLDYKAGPLNLAAKYEFITKLNIENQSQNTTGVSSFDNGVNTPNDIPALLTLGAAYDVTSRLHVSTGYHHYYDKSASMSNDRQKALSGGTDEYLAGVEYDITPITTISAGYQKTNYGMTDAFQEDMSFYVNSYSIGMGCRFKINSHMKANVAYFQTNYGKYTKSSTNYNNTGLPGKDIYTRTNKVFGVGIDYDL